MARTANKRYADEVARGNMGGYSHDVKFGRNPSVDSAAAEDIWDLGGSATYTASGGAAMFISSSDILDTEPIEITLLSEDPNGDWNLETFEITLAGRTKTAVITPSGDDPIRVHRMINRGTADLVGDVYIYENDTVTDGVPDTASLTRGKILIGNNQTLMAMRSIPSGSIGLLKKLVGSMTGPNPSATSDLKIWIRPFGEVFQLKGFLGGMRATGTTYFERDYSNVPIQVVAKSDIRIEGVSDTNSTPITAEFELTIIEDGA